MQMTEIVFDKKHWPKGGTTVDALLRLRDLTDLWTDYEDQASTFIAEALIDDPPHAHIDLLGGEIETFLWTVGGDCVCLREPLGPMIEDAISELDHLDNAAEVQKELLECWRRFQAAVNKAKERSGN